MDYQKVYNSIVGRAKNRVLEGYGEYHHITPKCIGGEDIPENLVKLTYREHFICHWLLHRIHPKHKGLAFTFHMMSSENPNKNLKRKYTPSSRVLEEARNAAKRMGESNPMKRPEVRAKVSAALKGRSNWHKGVPKSDEHRAKLSIALKGKNSKQLTQYTLNFKEVRKWPSTHSVQRELGFRYTNIAQACAGGASKSRPHYAYGYMWKYD